MVYQILLPMVLRWRASRAGAPLWIFWISMVRIPAIRPSNNKKDSKTDLSLRRRRIIHQKNHERNKRFQLPAFPTANQIVWHCSNSQSALRPKSGRNFRRFRQPIRSCGIVLTAHQRYGQNLAVTSTNVREFVSGPILAVAVRENV